MWTYKSVKDTFINYFTSRGHIHVPESSLSPADPSLLFTNSGMVQFKDIFLGEKNPTYSLVCNAQDCIRAGGKHNDLDDVGKDSYHHTYFTMLGNWSFNYNPIENNQVYFKERAISMAWDLLINIYQLDNTKIYVTYFAGNKDLNLEPDYETRDLWLKYIPENRILPFGMKENFWEMGSSGPCGPCSEIHYDKIGNRDATVLVNADDPTVIEIWNLVFMQYNRNKNGNISILSKYHVDTGIGCERLVAILQNCTNYQIDIYKEILEIIQKIVNGPEYQDLYGINDPTYINTAYRVLADHSRTLLMVLVSGITPSNTEQGYVLRKIIRRAIQYGTKLNAPEGFLAEIVKNIILLWDNKYHNLIKFSVDNNITKEFIINSIIVTLTTEEKNFSRALKKGMTKFNNLVKYGKTDTNNLFLLFSSFGLPEYVIQQLCSENNITFNFVEFETLLEEHRKKSNK